MRVWLERALFKLPLKPVFLSFLYPILGDLVPVQEEIIPLERRNLLVDVLLCQ